MQSQLLNEWKVWFSYLTEEEHNASQYFDKLQKVFTLSSLPDLFYLWKKSPLASLSNYFLSIENEKAECFKYVFSQVGTKSERIFRSSIRLAFSKTTLSQLGKTKQMLMEEGLCSKLKEIKKITRKFMKR